MLRLCLRSKKSVPDRALFYGRHNNRIRLHGRLEALGDPDGNSSYPDFAAPRASHFLNTRTRSASGWIRSNPEWGFGRCEGLRLLGKEGWSHWTRRSFLKIPSRSLYQIFYAKIR